MLNFIDLDLLNKTYKFYSRLACEFKGGIMKKLKICPTSNKPTFICNSVIK